MGQIKEKHRINSHPIIHCPMSEGVSEVIEQTSERSGGHKQSGASERANRRASSPVLLSGFLIILAHCEQEEEGKENRGK